jgi:hypothetical protein
MPREHEHEIDHEHEHNASADPRRRGRGRGGPRRGGPFGRPGGWQQGDLPDASDAAGWFAGRIPDDWFTGDLAVTVDRDEITVIGELPAPDSDEPAAAEGRITRWREDSRGPRMKIADEAQSKYGRSVAWGARIGETGQLFTHLAVPAMTRLRQSERQVLDTLVDSGVAKSRSEALAWCVRLVGQHSDEWLNGLRGAMSEVERLRAEGPSV